VTTGLVHPHRLQVSASVDGDVTTVRVHGELLQETVPVLAGAMAPVVEDGAVRTVVVDLSQTSFMDSTGLGTLVTLHNSVQRRGARFRLVRPEDRVFRLFELTRLDTLFEFVDAG
jgi:anti-sigma B factor antagonist